MRYSLGTTLAVIAFLVPSLANAQNCKEMWGQARVACWAAHNPKFAAKLERCKDEGRAMGLRTVRGENSLPRYVAGCLRR
jgi:hypothetical protein